MALCGDVFSGVLGCRERVVVSSQSVGTVLGRPWNTGVRPVTGLAGSM